MDLNVRRYDDLAIVTAKALLGIAGVLAISRLMVNHAGGRMTRGLEFMGSRTLVIYIFHWPFQAKSLTVALNLLHLPYWPAHILSLLCGVMGPLLLGELILRRVPVLRDVYFPVAARQSARATTQAAGV